MADTTAPGPRLTDVPAAALGELLRSVPRLVERTVHQAELVRSVASRLPCLSLVPGLRREASEADPGDVPAPISVLDVFEEPVESAPAAPTTPAAAAAAAAAPEAAAAATRTETVPQESELAVPDYDSLAASQVVPRLAMLSPEDLRSVLAYEQAHRHRQTILHRVTQLLEA